MKSANHVITSTPALEEFARKYNNLVSDIPTTLQVDRFTAKSDYQITDELILGHSGSHSTSKYLKSIEPAFEKLLQSGIKFKVLVTGDANFRFSNPDIPIEAKAWFAEDEASDLLRMDIGLYPLTDEPWVYGKRGGKALLYMAAGLPVIATAIGTNTETFSDRNSALLVPVNDMDAWVAAIKELCDKNGIVLIEDNCESLGTSLPEGKAGNFGLGSSFSFFVAHHMSTIEGGAACTDDDDLEEMLRITRANGWDRNLGFARQRKLREKHAVKNEFEAKYTFYDLAYNLRPTEITGFIGLTQLRFLEENCRIRQKYYLELEAEVVNNPDLIPIKHGHLSFLSSFAFPVICKTKELRARYIEQFSGAGVEIRPVIAGNIQRQPFYIKYVKESYPLPGADFAHECGFYFGNYPELNTADLDMLKSCLKRY